MVITLPMLKKWKFSNTCWTSSILAQKQDLQVCFFGFSCSMRSMRNQNFHKKKQKTQIRKKASNPSKWGLNPLCQNSSFPGGKPRCIFKNLKFFCINGSLHSFISIVVLEKWKIETFSNRCSFKRTNSHGRTTITEGSNLFCQKSSNHVPKKNASFKSNKKH